MVNKRVWNAILGCNLKNDRRISVCFQGKPFNITVIQAYAPTGNAADAEVKWFYKDLQDLLELTPKKYILFILGDWNAKVWSQETPGVTGKFGLGIQNKVGQRLIEYFQENTLVIANTLFQQHKRRLYTWTSPDGQHQNQIDYILYSQRWRSSIQSVKTRPGADYGCKDYNQSDFGVDHLVMFMYRVFSCVVGRCLLWPVCSLGKIILDFVLLHSIFQGQIFLLLQVFLNFLLLNSSPL